MDDAVVMKSVEDKTGLGLMCMFEATEPPPDVIPGHADSQSAMCSTDLHSKCNCKNSRKYRRGRKWKPYYKRDENDRRRVEATEQKRAQQHRAHMFAQGQPVAPYNTTQFLIEDHGVQEPDFAGRRHRQNSFNSVDSFEVESCSTDSEEEFLNQQFAEVYDNVHAEHLGSLSKDELLQEYLKLERKVEALEGELKVARQNAAEHPDAQIHPTEEEKAKMAIFEQEIANLQAENRRLRLENERLCHEDNEDDSDDEEASSSSSDSTVSSPSASRIT